MPSTWFVKWNKIMPYIGIILFLLPFLSCQQDELADHQEKRRNKIETQLIHGKKKLIVFAKVAGHDDPQKVVNEKWPEDIETTYNIARNSFGKIIYVGEFPESYSGDWFLALRYYFSNNGKLIAFTKDYSYFNGNCGDGIVKEIEIELYDHQFKVIKKTRTLTDGDGKYLSEEDCADSLDWLDIIKQPTIKEFLDLKKIRL